jgi:hypothetical protein
MNNGIDRSQLECDAKSSEDLERPFRANTRTRRVDSLKVSEENTSSTRASQIPYIGGKQIIRRSIFRSYFPTYRPMDLVQVEVADLFKRLKLLS